MAQCVVTGGAGFIGSNLARGLLERGHRVTILDNLQTGHRHNLRGLEGEIPFVEGDVRDPGVLNRLLPGCDWVFHQAALGSVPRSIANPLETHDANATGTLQILDAAQRAGVQRLIYAASSSAYGNTPTLPKQEAMPANPLSPYAVTKYVGELYCRVFCEVYGLETVSLRYFNVFGPRQDPNSQYAAVIPRFLSALLAGRPPTIYGTGEQTRDFTYVENVVEANIAAATAPSTAAGRVFNIGCGERVSLNGLLRELQSLTGSYVDPIYEPGRPGDVSDSLADIDLAEACLGYRPAVTLREGLRRTVEWFRSNSAAICRT